MDAEFFNSDIFVWVILPLLIFVSRILDVSIGTMRLIFVSKGFKYLAPVLGFFEVIIWLLAISQIMQHLDNFLCYIAYGLGFAMGNYAGIILEEKISIGTALLRVMPKKDTTELIKYLREQGYGVTAVEVEGMKGKIKMLLSIINRKDAKEYINMVHRFNPNAFYTVEDIKSVKEGYFKSHRTFSAFDHLHFLRRKGK
ncbi:MAG: DUF2179 domain-containing protein [Bacteroidetes bacterium]|nr:DUF2179 domain-containing protein [Bacteroidota bacterium]MBL7104189.1 DUF2179 domain-containing protein [Bacteroidales bacterium]